MSSETNTPNPDYDDNEGTSQLYPEDTYGTKATRIRTRGSVNTIPSELFDQMYNNPKIPVAGDLRRTYGNPTPLGMFAFAVNLGFMSACMMGWRGSSGTGQAFNTSLIFIAGMLQVLCSILEFFLGNTFSFCTFGMYGGLFISIGTSTIPFFNSAGFFSPDGVTFKEGLETPEFLNSVGMYFTFFSCMTFLVLVCSIRTNAILVLLFFTLLFNNIFTAAYYFKMGQYVAGNLLAASVGHKCQVASGAFGFVTSMCGFLIFIEQLMFAVDFPLRLPSFDLSNVVPSYTILEKRRNLSKSKHDMV